MFFCGQCGFQVAPGVTRCPRCGAAVNTGNASQSGEWHGDDQTVASPSFPQSGMPSQSGIQPQRGSGMYPGNDDYGAPTVFGSATHMDTPAYPGYGTPSSGQNYPTTMGGQPYQGQGQNYQGQYQNEQAARNRGRTTGLVLILIGLLMILGAAALFILQGHSGASGSTSVTTSQALIQHYCAFPSFV